MNTHRNPDFQLMEVCRQIHAETRLLPCQLNTIYLKDLGHVNHLLYYIDDQQREAITHISLCTYIRGLDFTIVDFGDKQLLRTDVEFIANFPRLEKLELLLDVLQWKSEEIESAMPSLEGLLGGLTADFVVTRVRPARDFKHMYRIVESRKWGQAG
jgi:hypothetical protein